MSESMYRAERLIENRAARINCLQQQHEEILVCAATDGPNTPSIANSNIKF